MQEDEFITFKGIGSKRLEEILAGIGEIRAALIGDICIDIYWRADMTKSELSRETPHFPLPVVEERMNPGAGGNAAANIAALRPQKMYLLGVTGDDWRGRCLLHELHKRNIDTEYVLASSSRVTSAYCKPLRRGVSDIEYEDPRIDFDNYSALPESIEQSLIEALHEVSEKVDVLCVSDQLRYGCITPGVRECIIRMAKQGLKVVVDSRDRIGEYTDVYLKPNELECIRAAYSQANETPPPDLNGLAGAAVRLAKFNNSRICMTLGSKGCIYYENGLKPVYVPSYKVAPPLDTVGAGDCFLSAFSCALAAGADGPEAASFANMAADVIIKKIGTTGTASPDEIRGRYKEITKE